MNFKQLIDLKIEEWLLMFSILFMVVLIFLQVISRYVFNISIGWSSEISRFLLIWITWISASYVIRLREHIRITIIIDRFNSTIRKAVEIFVNICWFVFALVMAIEGTKVALGIKKMGQTTSVLQWEMWLVYLIIPISGCLMIVRVIQQIYLIFSKKSEESSEAV